MVEKRLVYMTPEWKDAFRYATTLADQLGLEKAIAGSPGWSESGGPWVTPAQAMKKLVWSETRVEGGTAVHRRAAEAAHDDRPVPERAVDRTSLPMLRAAGRKPPPEFYKDTAVVAYRVPAADVPMRDAAADGHRRAAARSTRRC